MIERNEDVLAVGRALAALPRTVRRAPDSILLLPTLIRFTMTLPFGITENLRTCGKMGIAVVKQPVLLSAL